MMSSVIIPTRDRHQDLKLCLDSLHEQTIKPDEIIIADKGSKTVSRNQGIRGSSGDIIFIFDDDVILEPDYIERILDIYKQYPNALGVQGYITNHNKLNSFLRKLFYQSYFEKDGCRVLASTGTTYPYELNNIISCEWLSGSNCSFRKEVFKEFMFDEQINRYEDTDLSYRIYRKHPGSLYITPYARLYHNESSVGRIPKKEATYLDVMTSLYFFYKNMNHNIKNYFIYILGRFGYTLFNINNINLKDYIKAYQYVFRHLDEIKKCNLDFHNKHFIVKLIGGMGNQMFQYAYGRALSLCNNAKLKLDVSWFKVPHSHAGPSQMVPYWIKVFNCPQDCIRFSNGFIHEGYWQSEKYFKDYKETILNDFTFPPFKDIDNQNISHLIKKTNSISVHVRRKDYVSVESTKDFYGDICTLDYYKQAIDLIMDKFPDATLFFFSDDMGWVKDNLGFGNGYYIDWNQGDNTFCDMHLMSLCKHNIIANSSFSWWGAYLNRNPDKIVISPSRWFNDPGVDTSDLLPEDWLKVIV